MSEKFTVDYIGIGAAKSGSTWIARCLAEHPQVFLADIKEIEYFNAYTNIKNKKFCKIKNAIIPNKRFKKGINWYKKHFTACKPGMIKGEFCNRYLIDPVAPKAIKDTFPDVKLIVVLRNPIDRTYSHYLMRKNFFKYETRSFEDAINEQPLYTERGMYYTQLKRYLKYFKREQLLILFLEDIKKNPEQEINKLFTFLHVKTDVKLSLMGKRANPARVAKSSSLLRSMDKFVRLMTTMRLSFIVTFFKKIKINRIITRFNASPALDPPMNPETRIRLAQIFESENRKLSELVNRDFSHWK